jgi:hypothetical protein
MFETNADRTGTMMRMEDMPVLLGISLGRPFGRDCL